MRLGRFVEWLRSSPRRAWCTTFLLVTCLNGLWALANPIFAGPDEPAHVIRAVALDHGQLTGTTPSSRQIKALGLTPGGDVLLVRAPEIYQHAIKTLCFSFRAKVTAECLRFTGPRRDTEIEISTTLYPPAYYAVVGLVSRLYPPGSATVYGMRFIEALIAAALIATAVGALRGVATPRLVAVGLLFAITPMVFFLNGVVNPSSLEISASIALWVCGLALVSQAKTHVDKRLVTCVGTAGCALALSRQLSPLWLALIALTMLGIVNRASLRNLARSNWARLWVALIMACTLAQVAWDLINKPLDVTRSGHKAVGQGIVAIARGSFGASYSRYFQMIGQFGWLDTKSPVATYLLWTAGIAFLLLLAIAWAKRRDVAMLLALLAATIAVPVALETAEYGGVRLLFWQGRYTLPLAIGIPILAAYVVSSTERGRQLVSRRLLLTMGVTAVIAHILAFGQNLRRYTVGYQGSLGFLIHPRWSPPLPPLLLASGYVVAIVAFTAWLLAAGGHSDERTGVPQEVAANGRPALAGEQRVT